MSKEDPSYLYESLSRCVVEVVKHEWPQQWPSFIPEMGELCGSGKPCQIEIVMRILRRLAEDVIELNLVQASRRKDIQQELNTSLHEVMPFLIRSLEDTTSRLQSGVRMS